jgi:phage-related protein
MGIKKASGSAKPPAWEVELKSKLKELRRLEKWAFRPRHGRTDFYEYLKGGYNLCDWTDPKISRQIRRRVAKLSNIKVRAGTIPIRIVIDATSSSEDRQEKSEWAQALEYAISQKARGTGLKKFFKRHGGPSGCATAMAALRKRKAGSKPLHPNRGRGRKTDFEETT